MTDRRSEHGLEVSRVDRRAPGCVASRSRASRRRAALLLGPLLAPLAGCVQLVPDLDWEVASPFGSVGMGVDDNAPGVVSTSEALPMPDEARPLETERLRPHGLRAPFEPDGLELLDPGVRSAIARATGEPLPAELVPAGATSDAASAAPADGSTTDGGVTSDADGTLGDPASTVEPGTTAVAEGPETGPEPGPESGPESRSPEGEPRPAPAGEAAATVVGPASTDADTDADVAAGGESTDPAPAQDQAAPAESEDAASAQDTDSGLAAALPPEPMGDTSSAAPVQEQPPGDASAAASEPATRQGSDSTTYFDLGLWFGRELVTAERIDVGTVRDLRLDLERRRAVDLVVEVPRLPWALGFPAALFVPIQNVNDGLPIVDLLTLGAPDVPAAPPVPRYGELVGQAFASEPIETLAGTVLSVEETPHQGGPAVVLVKLRDAENLLHRVDLGPVAWFEDLDELPAEGEALQVRAVRSRDERGPLWHVAAILTADAPIRLRDEAGAALREAAAAVEHSAPLWSLRRVLGRSVHVLRAPAEGEADQGRVDATATPPTEEVAVVAGVLMQRASGALRYMLLRPCFGDEDGTYWLVPLERLEARTGEPWVLDLDPERIATVPRIHESEFGRLDAPDVHAAVRAYWGLPEPASEAAGRPPAREGDAGG